RVGDAVAQRRAAERLRLDEDAAQLAFLEAALLLDGAQELLVVKVPLSEVPAQRQARDQLAVYPFVVLDAIDRFRQEQRKRAAVQVHEPEAHHAAENPDRGFPV